MKKVDEKRNYTSKFDEIIILQNLDIIQPYLDDLYSMNYKIIDDQKYARIYLNNSNEILMPVSDSFRIINLVDKNCIDRLDKSFLNKFEKIEFNFIDLLDNEQKMLTKSILEEIRLKEEIKQIQRNINYDLDQLLINCDEEEIGSLVYYYTTKMNKEKSNRIDINYIKDKIYSKISNILPQDIIINLNDDNQIKKMYYEQRRFCNLKEYIKYIEKERNTDNNKISIIYTFSYITDNLEGYERTEQIMLSEIKTENHLQNIINNIKRNNLKNNKDNHIIIINFEQSDLNKIQFVTDFINNYYKEDNYNYILIIHIQRSFIYEK